jgi:hypothetical protein
MGKETGCCGEARVENRGSAQANVPQAVEIHYSEQKREVVVRTCRCPTVRSPHLLAYTTLQATLTCQDTKNIRR